MNTTSPDSLSAVMTWLTVTCDLAHSLLRIELFCREMDQPLTGPSCFSLMGVVLLSASDGGGFNDPEIWDTPISA